jgi:hypothetical protein
MFNRDINFIVKVFVSVQFVSGCINDVGRDSGSEYFKNVATIKRSMNFGLR